jgi:hypothetical protein
VPFLKFSRDKRGYENYYLFDGKGRPRLLFWFRTPPQVKVGRAPFSDDVRKMVEAQNPGVTFDWARIMATPIPPPDVDYWRERRRAEKAAKRAAREPDVERDADVEAEVVAEAVADVDEAEKETAAVAQEATADRADAEAVVEAVEEAEGAAPAVASIAASDAQAGQGHRHRRRRRRRRGGRRGPGGPPDAPVTDVTQPQSEPLPEPETPSNDEV